MDFSLFFITSLISPQLSRIKQSAYSMTWSLYMWLTLDIHCSAPVPTQTTGGCLALGSFIKKTGEKSEKNILKIEKAIFGQRQ